MDAGKCRFCGAHLKHTFADLGMSPLSNSYLRPEELQNQEVFYPLHVYVCGNCFLVQLEEFASPENIFTEYSYFSSYSESWLKHAGEYADLMVERFALGNNSLVVELASNDGYLLQYFKQKDIPVLGVEPASNVAAVATAKGIPTLTAFFSVKTARALAAEGKQADLLLGNNVLAHVPDINDFVKGMNIMLKPGGVITMEFPHVLQLIRNNQFDTIYHEHFSYLSFRTVENIFLSHGLVLFDVDELTTHGGSIRIYGRHVEDEGKCISGNVERMKDIENDAGLDKIETYAHFSQRIGETKRNLLEFLIQAKRAGKSIVGYGAPAKGNTLLNYCGIRNDFIDYTVDRSPHKQGRFLPGTHIPVYHPDKIKETKPDFILILPWNIKDEIVKQISYVHEWGCKFIVPIPSVKVF